jgi:hypothetical protein
LSAAETDFALARKGKSMNRKARHPSTRSLGLDGISIPFAGLEEMRYVDRTAQAGEKHTYAVVTINCAGLRSKPGTQ